MSQSYHRASLVRSTEARCDFPPDFGSLAQRLHESSSYQPAAGPAVMNNIPRSFNWSFHYDISSSFDHIPKKPRLQTLLRIPVGWKILPAHGFGRGRNLNPLGVPNLPNTPTTDIKKQHIDDCLFLFPCAIRGARIGTQVTSVPFRTCLHLSAPGALYPAHCTSHPLLSPLPLPSMYLTLSPLNLRYRHTFYFISYKSVVCKSIFEGLNNLGQEGTDAAIRKRATT